jgi:uncharacterized repeat protein (TIGR01451 family)
LLTYTIVALNGGDADASGAVITDALDSNVIFAQASDAGSYSSGVVSWNIGGIGVEQAVTRTLSVTVTDVASGTNLSNTAWLTSAEGVGDSDTITTKVTAAADLGIAKWDSADPVLAGTSFAYGIGVANNGPSLATGVVVEDVLPVGLTFDPVASSPECSAAGQTVTCDIGDLPAGGQVARTIAVMASAALADGRILTNTASVSGLEPDPIPDNNSDDARTTFRRQADLQIAKKDSADPVLVGTSFNYGITVTNTGPSLATGVVVSDPLPLGLTFDAGASSPECSAVGQNVACPLGAVPVSGEVTLFIAVKVATSLEDGVVLSNTASVSGSEPDPNQGDNSATEETLVEKRRIFLPIVFKPAWTELYVFNDKTGGNVTFAVLGTPVSCVVPNNTTRFCGAFPPGIYQVRVNSACGEAVFTRTYASGRQKTTVYCK